MEINFVFDYQIVIVDMIDKTYHCQDPWPYLRGLDSGVPYCFEAHFVNRLRGKGSYNRIIERTSKTSTLRYKFL